MKKSLLLSAFSLFLLINTSWGQTITSKAVISNLGKAAGNIYLGVYDSEASYMTVEKAVVKKIVAVTKEQSSVSIALGDLKAGKYAVVVFLDENNNGELDTNLLGIPKEKYGFSGTVKPMFRAPNFTESAVTISSSSATVTIKLN